MMKFPFNTTILFAIVFVFLVSAPVPLFAATTTEPEQPLTRKDFCASFDRSVEQITQDLALREERFLSNAAAQRARIEERLTERDRILLDSRVAWDSQREQISALLLGRATTTALREAIERFLLEVESAVKQRRNEVDTALIAYRSDLTTILTSRDRVVQEATSTLALRMNSARETALADCRAGTPPLMVRERFVTALRSAKEKFLITVTAINKQDTRMNAVVTLRKDAVEQAVKRFHITVSEAGANLKKVMPDR